MRGSVALCQMANRRIMPKRPAQVAGWAFAGCVAQRSASFLVM